jgi:aminoglycoside phosphotransferase (APT) family kinase protein
VQIGDETGRPCRSRALARLATVASVAQREAVERAINGLDPGADVLDVVELLGGTSANVLRVDYRDAGGEVRHVVFRQHRSAEFKGHAARVTTAEYEVLEALWRRGFEVPRPLLLDGSGAVTDPFLLTDWVDGSTGVASSDLGSALTQMADFLARLHDLDPADLDVDLEALEDPVAAVVGYLPDDELGTRIQELLSAGYAHASNPPVLTHGDYWPGNVMWRDGRLVAVIDWEDARIGDPLADLACARVELRCEYGSEATGRFTELYLRRAAELGHPLPLEGLPLWDVYVAAAALTTMDLWGLDPAEEARRRGLTVEFYTEAAATLLDG